MKDYMAPMEGITNHVYRSAYHRYYHPMDKYFTPFLSAKPDKKLSFKEICEVSPETNEGLHVVPQILANNADDFINTARILRDKYGHKEINLNLGCPSGTVTAKGKGAGFLAFPLKLDRFLEKIYEGLPDMDISIKTRVGFDEEEEWDALFSIYEKYPVKELIIHPRIRQDFYKNQPRLQAYQKAYEKRTLPLCYNGDLFTREDYVQIAGQFPDTECYMYGRGLITDPGLVSQIREGSHPDKDRLSAFHEEVYIRYQKLLSGEKNVLFRMKELWSYMGLSFTNYEKYLKKVRKAQHFKEYQAAVSSLFAEQELIFGSKDDTSGENAAGENTSGKNIPGENTWN